MNISVGKSSFLNIYKIFRRLPSSYFDVSTREPCSSLRSKYTTSTTTLLPASTSYHHRILIQYNPISKSRLNSTSTNRFFSHVGPIVCGRFLSTKANSSSVSNTDSLTYKHAALTAKIRKRVAIRRPDIKSGITEVVAYAISEEIYLEKLGEFLASQRLYQKQTLPSDAEDAIYVKAVYEVDEGCSREVFFFRDGAVVFWNMSYLERKEILQTVLDNFCESPFDFAQILAENESLNFIYTDNPQTSIIGNEIKFSTIPEPPATNVLEKYAFSDALGLSVKLALWEESLAQFVESIEPLIDDLRDGRKIRHSRESLLQKTGQLFTLRHFVNLSSDLLDTPDFYWDREGLEPLYQKTINYLNVAKRTRVINEKLKHCCELIELLSDHLNDQHHTRLEVMIIVLIMVEVMFEIIHYVEKYYSGADTDHG